MDTAVHIHLPVAATTEQMVQDIRTVLERHAGDEDVILHLRSNTEERVMVLRGFGVQDTDELRWELELLGIRP